MTDGIGGRQCICECRPELRLERRAGFSDIMEKRGEDNGLQQQLGCVRPARSGPLPGGGSDDDLAIAAELLSRSNDEYGPLLISVLLISVLYVAGHGHIPRRRFPKLPGDDLEGLSGQSARPGLFSPSPQPLI